MNFRRWYEAVRRFILLPSNCRKVDHLLLGSIDAKNHSVNFRSWCEAVRRSSCNLLFSFCSFRSSESNRCFSSPSYRNNRQVLNPLLISLKFLHVISILCKTEWWWELSTWSQKINLTDTSTNSPYNFYWKCMGTTKQNFEVLAIIKANKHQSTTTPISSSVAESCENEFYSHENKKITFTSMVSHLASLWNALTRLQSSLCFFTIGIF